MGEVSWPQGQVEVEFGWKCWDCEKDVGTSLLDGLFYFYLLCFMWKRCRNLVRFVGWFVVWGQITQLVRKTKLSPTAEQRDILPNFIQLTQYTVDNFLPQRFAPISCNAPEGTVPDLTLLIIRSLFQNFPPLPDMISDQWAHQLILTHLRTDYSFPMDQHLQRGMRIM